MTFSSTGVTIQRFTKVGPGTSLMLDVVFADGPLDTVWQTPATAGGLAWRA
jgi:hypothetical protein